MKQQEQSNKPVRRNPGATIERLIAILLMLVMIAAAVLAVLQFCTPEGSFLKPSGWFSHTISTVDPPEEDPVRSDEELTDGSFKIGEVAAAEGVSLKMRALSAEEYEDYGITPQAESAIRFTLTVHPSYATNRTFDWSFRLKDSSDGFLTETDASGHPVQVPLADFLTLTPSADTLSATAECKRDFWEQLEIVASYRENPALKVTCTCDYLQRATSAASFRAQNGSVVALEKLESNPAVYSSYYVTLGGLTKGTIPVEIEYGATEIELDPLFLSENAALGSAGILTLTNDRLELSSDWLLQFFPAGERTADKYSKLKQAYDTVCARYAGYEKQGVILSRSYTLKQDGKTIKTGVITCALGIEFSATSVSDAVIDNDHAIF